MKFRDCVDVFLIVLLALAIDPRRLHVSLHWPDYQMAVEPIEPEARFIGGAELWFEPSTAPVILAEERV
jgi:hypothetical protein